MIIILIIVEILVLFFLSRAVNSILFGLLYLLFHSKRVAMVFTTIVFFPGTVVHELAHLLTAEIIGVRTGTLSLIPEFATPKDGEHTLGQIQAGSVEITKSDPFRRSLIGVAPLLVGLVSVTILAWQISIRFSSFVGVFSEPKFWTNPLFWLMLLFGYLLFTISNNMFPSDTDMTGVTPVIILLLLMGICAYLVGFRISLHGQALTIIQDILTAVRNNLIIVIGFNAFLFALIRLLLFFVMKKRRVVFAK